MRIVATADLHGSLPERIPECDVLVIAGDVCPVWDHSIVTQRRWLEDNFSPWLCQQPAKFILGIGGNHDFILERDESFARSLPWIYLLDESFTWVEAASTRTIKFWGIPWVPNLSRWAFHHMDHELDGKFTQIPSSVDVIISHGPPHGYCDMTVPRFGSVNAGFPGANPVLEARQPKLFVCGHIHEGYGMADHPSGAVICNVSHMTENYKPINPPQYILLDSEKNIILDPSYPASNASVGEEPDLDSEFWKAAY